MLNSAFFKNGVRTEDGFEGEYYYHDALECFVYCLTYIIKH